MMIEENRASLEKVVPRQVKPEKVRPPACEITLRDGRIFTVTGLSVTTLKFMRRMDGGMSITKDGVKTQINGKDIKKISPLYHHD